MSDSMSSRMDGVQRKQEPEAATTDVSANDIIKQMQEGLSDVTVRGRNGMWFTCEQVEAVIAFAAPLRARIAELEADIENAVWNLGGCDAIASGHAKPHDYDHASSRPALDSVSRLADRADALAQQVATLEAEVERLQALVPHEGDGACDHCGRIPSVDIPTHLCDECADGVKRAEDAEKKVAELEAENKAAQERGKLIAPVLGIEEVDGVLRNVRADALAQQVAELTKERDEAKLRVWAAEDMAKVCDDWVERGEIDARSALADARLSFGDPYKYPAHDAKIATLEQAVNFFASVIKSGESWSATCEQTLASTRGGQQ